MQPKLDDKDYLVERILRPTARMDFVHDLKEFNVTPTSMIDISDGLASELFHICTQSEVGVIINSSQVPIDDLTKQTAIEFNISPDACAFNGGEDYELLFTVSEADYEKIRKHHEVIAIGQIRPKKDGVKLITKAGTEVPLEAQGWKHFSE